MVYTRKRVRRAPRRRTGKGGTLSPAQRGVAIGVGAAYAKSHDPKRKETRKLIYELAAKSNLAAKSKSNSSMSTSAANYVAKKSGNTLKKLTNKIVPPGLRKSFGNNRS
jgi:hypothetical protein